MGLGKANISAIVSKSGQPKISESDGDLMQSECIPAAQTIYILGATFEGDANERMFHQIVALLQEALTEMQIDKPILVELYLSSISRNESLYLMDSSKTSSPVLMKMFGFSMNSRRGILAYQDIILFLKNLRTSSRNGILGFQHSYLGDFKDSVFASQDAVSEVEFISEHLHDAFLFLSVYSYLTVLGVVKEQRADIKSHMMAELRALTFSAEPDHKTASSSLIGAGVFFREKILHPGGKDEVVIDSRDSASKNLITF